MTLAMLVPFLISAPAYSESWNSVSRPLNDIKEFAEGICGDIPSILLDGEVEETKIRARIEGVISGLLNYLRIEVDAEGFLHRDGVKYRELPYDDLREVLEDVRRCKLELATILLDILKGILTSDKRDEAGRTPLHIAAKDGESGIATTLLSAGVDPNARELQRTHAPPRCCPGTASRES